MNKYPTYKQTNINWVPEIPNHWEIKRTKRLFRLITDPAPKGNTEELLSIYTDIGVKPRKELEERGNKASTTDDYWIVRKGDIIVNKLLAWMGAIGISDFYGVTSPAYDILRAIDKSVNPYYYNYIFRNKITHQELKRYSKGIMDMRLRLYFDEFGQIFLPFPPVKEQDEIVNYLEYKTEQTDRFITIKKQLIALLKEQKTAIINKAVTKGLNPNAPMKDSGIEWLGEIPEHWEIFPLKYIAKINQRTLPENTPLVFKINYIDIGNVNSDGEIREIQKFLFRDAPSRARRVIKAGDVIISTVRTYLKAIALIDENNDEYIASTGYAVLSSTKHTLSRFLYYALRADYFIDKVQSLSYGVSYPAINSTCLGTIKLAIPPITEQKEILKFIEREFILIQKAISRAEKEIELIKEYRQSLIAHAVLGKIDVREWQPKIKKGKKARVLKEPSVGSILELSATNQIGNGS